MSFSRHSSPPCSCFANFLMFSYFQRNLFFFRTDTLIRFSTCEMCTVTVCCKFVILGVIFRGKAIGRTIRTSGRSSFDRFWRLKGYPEECFGFHSTTYSSELFSFFRQRISSTVLALPTGMKCAKNQGHVEALWHRKLQKPKFLPNLRCTL